MKGVLTLLAMAVLFLLGSSIAEPSGIMDGIMERVSIPWWGIVIIASALFLLLFLYCACILASRADDHKEKIIGRA